MTDTDQRSAAQTWVRRLPFLVILTAAVVALIFFRDALSLSALEQNREALIALRDAHYLLASLAFVAVYAVVVVASIPGSLFLTLTGGFLFGFGPGVAFNVSAATLGACVVFLAARMGFGQGVADKIAARGGAVARLQEGLQDNQWSVLLTMRLIPVVPFFLANLLPAFVGVRFSVFAITTLVGIIPAAAIYTQLGAGLGDIFAKGEVPHLNILLQPQFGLPLIGLGVLAALPMVIKWISRSRR